MENYNDIRFSIYKPTSIYEEFYSPQSDRYSIIRPIDDNEYYLRMWSDKESQWVYPYWSFAQPFHSLEEIEEYLNNLDWNNATLEDIEDMSNTDMIYSTKMMLIRNITPIKSAISTKNAAKNMVRVKSSNIWSYGVNIKNHGDATGDVLCQFKDSNGGPGDLYIYYDVPVRVYRRWNSAPSKGHYFWQYIRNNFKYSKLTGDKRGKLSNAIN